MPKPAKGQLAMFMTPRQILQHYQVLGGDREELGNFDPDWDEPATGRGRTWDFTGRPTRTGGRPNITGQRYTPSGNLQGGYFRQPGMETDEEVWSRKLAESQMDPDEYEEHRQGQARKFDWETALERPSAPQPPSSSAGSSRWDSYEMHQDSYLGRKQSEFYERPSLYESVRDQGVQMPVHLSTQFGDMGKPEIVGGHHRIAAALSARPDDYIPVLHHRDIHEAQGPRWNGSEDRAERSWKYT